MTFDEFKQQFNGRINDADFALVTSFITESIGLGNKSLVDGLQAKLDAANAQNATLQTANKELSGSTKAALAAAQKDAADKIKAAQTDAQAKIADAQAKLKLSTDALAVKTTEFATYKKIVEAGSSFIKAKIADKSLDDTATIQVIAIALPQLEVEANKDANQRKLDTLDAQIAAAQAEREKVAASLMVPPVEGLQKALE